MSHRLLWFTAALIVLVLSCMPMRRELKSSALDFLYPDGTDAVPASDIRLTLPVRVGVAFAPGAGSVRGTFPETSKQELLERIAASFRDHEGIASVEVIPSTYLSPHGSFDNLDRVAVAFGIDLMTLVSYEQIQFSETGRSSWAYWTLVGAYIVKGEKNDTRTMLDAVVYDIPSRAMLFHATGRSGVAGKSTPIDVSGELRERSEEGFDEATDDLITNLRTNLAAFEQQAATGTVRGAGTPAIAMQDASGRPVGHGGEGGGGAGALGLGELLGAASLVALGLLGRIRRRRQA